jgi:hypothetical protein
MQQWLCLAAGLWLLGSSGAQAQIKGLGAVEIAEIAKNRTLHLRIAQDPAESRHLPLMQGMVVHQDLAPNALVGVGLANSYAKRARGDFRMGERPVRSRKPAVTFVFKF